MVKEKGVEFRNTTVIGPGVTHSYFSSERERERERERKQCCTQGWLMSFLLLKISSSNSIVEQKLVK
jgi:hypothetical protein